MTPASARTDMATTLVPSAAPATVPSPSPIGVRGETAYDRATSLLIAIATGVGLVVLWLGLIYLTTRAYGAQVTAPLEIIEVVGGDGGGGSLDGDPGGDAEGGIEVPGGAAGEAASNADGDDAPDFEEPSMGQIASTVLDLSAPLDNAMADIDVGSGSASGGIVATGRRMSRAGTGRIGLGPGGAGDGGVRREQRWSVVYNPGQTPDDYARQLDALGVEVGVIQNNTMRYVSRLSAPTPVSRFGQHAGDGRLFFVWQSTARKASDVELLRRAGVEVGESPIFHFYPREVEEQLAQLEARYRGRQPIEIRTTRFSVVGTGGSVGFAVMAQEAAH